MMADPRNMDDTSTTYYRSTSNTAIEEYSDMTEEIERLENMMIEAAMHSDNKHSHQHREMHRIRRAPLKHKRPHMNRRIIR